MMTKVLAECPFRPREEADDSWAVTLCQKRVSCSTVTKIGVSLRWNLTPVTWQFSLAFPGCFCLFWYLYYDTNMWIESVSPVCVFKASALWANAFYKSICPSVRLCLSVHFLRYRSNVFLPPLPKVGCQDLESFGKSNGKKWSQINKK